MVHACWHVLRLEGQAFKRSDSGGRWQRLLEERSSHGNMPSTMGALAEPPLHRSNTPVYFFSVGFDTGAAMGIAAPFGF